MPEPSRWGRWRRKLRPGVVLEPVRPGVAEDGRAVATTEEVGNLSGIVDGPGVVLARRRAIDVEGFPGERLGSRRRLGLGRRWSGCRGRRSRSRGLGDGGRRLRRTRAGGASADQDRDDDGVREAGSRHPAEHTPGARSAVLAASAMRDGAGDEIRTRDIHLGKVALCQLSYSRPLRGAILPDGQTTTPGRKSRRRVDQGPCSDQRMRVTPPPLP